MKPSTLLFILLLGCSEDKSETENDGQSTDNTDTTDGSDGTDAESAENPVIVDANAWCYPGSNDGEQWMFQMFVEDPQGEDNLGTMMDSAAGLYDAGGNLVGSHHSVVLYPDDSYTGSANLSVACAQAESFEARFIAVDLDGNISEEYTVAAYAGTSAAGK